MPCCSPRTVWALAWLWMWLASRTVVATVNEVLADGTTRAQPQDLYDFNDPFAAHTDKAIQFDKQGKRELSLRAFRAAVTFQPNAETLTNLAVCLMRMRKYMESYDTMRRAKALVVNARDKAHLDENWEALMQSMRVEGVAIPNLDDTPAGDGTAPGSPPVAKKAKRKRRKPAVNATTSASARRGPVFRDLLLHQRDAPLGEPLPRVSVEQIDSGDPEFEDYRERRMPFILTGGLEGWGALNEWPSKWETYLPDLFPDAVTDFYPYNMLLQERQSPFLTRLPRAVQELLITPGSGQQQRGSRFSYDSSAMEGRYLHLQLTPKMWQTLEERGDIKDPNDRHWHLSSDEWLEACLGYPDSELAAEYHLKTHWKIILIGARGAGMFNHSDSLQTSSWHAHLMGSKWWYVCGDDLNGEPVCFEDVLAPGETLYYGKGWHHETQNLETPTMTLTDTVAFEHNFESVADQLHATCALNRHSFDFSAQLCDALDECFAFWHERHLGTPKPDWKWMNWRKLVNPDVIARRESVLPAHNNYDGRNYITE